MAQELMITQYVEELGYSDIFKTKKPQTTNVELPAYTTASILDPTGDVDKDGIINTADKINVPFPTDKSFPGK
jgi:hypothetical protein